MMRKKNSFLTFCFAMLPGAGEMYLGLMKKGTVIMLTASVVLGLWGFLNLGIFAVFMPVLWFYSFFDTFSLRAMNDEERFHAAVRFDRAMQGFLGRDWNSFLNRRHTVVGWVCILFGAYVLFHNFVTPWLHRIGMPWLNGILDRFPTLIVVGLIIWLGVHLISTGTRPSLPPDDDFVEYGSGKGGNSHE